MKKAILFDLDGTLWDSSDAVVASWNEVIETLPNFHKKITKQEMEGLMGKTMRDIALTYFNTCQEEEALDYMKRCTDYENEYIRKYGGVLFEGLEDVLKALKAQGYFLAIVSNCQCGYIEAFLEHHQLGKYIDDTQSYGDNPKPKGENIALVVSRNQLSPAYYVGDIQGDCDAATFAGVPFIHARYGFGKVPGAEYGIDDIRFLPELMQQLVEEGSIC